MPKLSLVLASVLVAAGAVWVGSRAVAAPDNAAMPQVGQMAPGFTLPSQTGAPMTLSQYHGKWVVLYFYPKDMTSGCTIEAHNFQQDQPKFKALDAVVLGVSVDSVQSHQQFCAKDGLNFHLLSDTDKKVVAEYGSLASYGPVQFAKRNTFLINPQGKIVKVWVGVNPNDSSTEVLDALRAEQHRG